MPSISAIGARGRASRALAAALAAAAALWTGAAAAQATTIVQVAAGHVHTCALEDTGQVWCWGSNWYGQLGHGAPIGVERAPVRVPGLTGVVELSLGQHHSCARLESGRVRCWGRNQHGQLGNDSFVDSARPVTVQDLRRVAQLSVGHDHGCALLANGRVRCWGRNWDGQLGNGRFGGPDQPTPVDVVDLVRVAEISAGPTHSCGLRRNGRIACWGNNFYYQLGDGTRLDRNRPVDLSGRQGYSGVAAGHENSCARRDNGRAFCWGFNSAGQIGDGTTTSRPTPVLVRQLSRVAEIAASGGRFHCARLSSGRVRCWGHNASGQIGDGTRTNRHTPVEVQGLRNATQISLGAAHGCAVRSNGQVLCWGGNNQGQLGDGGSLDQLVPVEVAFP